MGMKRSKTMKAITEWLASKAHAVYMRLMPIDLE
jgi:hypothetical protein